MEQSQTITTQPQTYQTTAQIVKKRSGVGRLFSCSCIGLILILCALGGIFTSGFFDGVSNFTAPLDAITKVVLVANNTYNDNSASSVRQILCNASQVNSVHYKNFECQNVSSQNSNSLSSLISSNNTNSNSPTSVNSSDIQELIKRDSEITGIIDKTSPAVVTVVAKSFYQSYFSSQLVEQSGNIGSGFIISQDGYIITNKHVVSDTNYDYQVLIQGEKDPISIDKITIDPDNDIAILKINKTNLPYLNLGSSSNLKKGQTVIAIGSALGDLTDTVTVGVISGLNRDINVSDTTGQSTESIKGAIQTDAAINHGNSGGPLINIKGEVVGVNVATSDSASNISFALPIDVVKQKFAEFKQYGKFISPFIGISYRQQSFILQDGTTIYGALISQVATGSSAENAGLKRGDIVTKANGNNLKNNSLQSIIQGSKVGDKLNLEVYRNKETLNILVEVKAREN